MKVKFTLALIVVAILITAQPAMAYVDPGTGSILLQIAFALFASSYLWLKRVLDFVRRLFRKNKDV